MAGATRVGLIGCGVMGMGLGRALVQIPNALMTSVYDTNAKAGAVAAKEFNASQVDNLQTLISPENVDAVVIAVPPADHERLARMAAAQGIHVFCEKPLALSSAACRRIIKECAANKALLMVGQVLRYFPVPARILELIASGRAGKPFAMHVTRIGHGWGKEGGWRLKSETSGGLLPEVNIHEIDFMRCLFGEVDSVSASGGNWRTPFLDFQDTVQVLLRFENGASGTLTASLASELAVYSATLLCTNGTFHADNMWSHFTFKQAKAKELVYESKDYRGVPPFIRELKEFITSIRKEEPATIPGEEGLEALKIIEAAQKSLKTGEEVHVKRG